MGQYLLTINGHKVYSDKSIQNIINTRIEFTDGSWIDVSTGEKYIKGGDDITLEPLINGESTVEKVTIGPKSFTSSAVMIRDVATSSISVQPYDGTEVEVTIEGNKISAEGITVKQEGNIVLIEGQTSSANGGINIVSGGSRINISGGYISGGMINIGGSSNIIMTGGNIINSGGIGGPDVQITVKVPLKTKVSLYGDWSDANIGDTNGPLHIISTGVRNVKAGHVSSTNISLQGSSKVHIVEVQELLAINIMGSGDVKVDNGSVTSLDITITGSGNVNFEGIAEDAELLIMGSGDIYVARIKNRPSQSVMGSGDIRIGKIG